MSTSALRQAQCEREVRDLTNPVRAERVEASSERAPRHFDKLRANGDARPPQPARAEPVEASSERAPPHSSTLRANGRAASPPPPPAQRPPNHRPPAPPGTPTA